MASGVSGELVLLRLSWYLEWGTFYIWAHYLIYHLYNNDRQVGFIWAGRGYFLDATLDTSIGVRPAVT